MRFLLLLSLLFLAGCTQNLGADPRIFTSGQVGSNPVSGYILSTNGVTSTWIADTGGSGGSSSFFNGFMTSSLYITDGVTTSTVRANALYLTTSTANMLGLFNVDSSGNTSVSGTLKVFGGTNLGNLTATNIFSTNVSSTFTSSTFASSTALSTNAFFQGGLADCELDTDSINYDLQTGKFICGDDDTGGGASFDGYLLKPYHTTDGAVTSTLRGNALYISTSTANLLGLFNVESGNVSASGTLRVFGGTTLSNLTATNIFGTNVSSTFTSSTYSSSTLLTTGGLTVNSLLSLPNDSVTDVMVVPGLTISGGSVNNSPIGASTPSTAIFTYTTSTFLTVTTSTIEGGFFQDGLGDCMNDTDGLNYNATTGKFVCGDDDQGAGSAFAGALYGGTPFSTTNGSTTSTLRANGLYLVTSTANMLGLFNVDVSGNTSASGTLKIFGLSTLTGFISNASSSIGAGLQIAGATNVSSSLFVSTSIFLGQSPGKRAGTFTIDGLSGNLSTSGTAQFFGLGTLRSGFIANASSSIAGGLTVNGALNVSSSLVFSDASVQKSAINVISRVIYFATTTDFFDLGYVPTASTINKCTAYLQCEESCQTSRPGFQVDLYHGSNHAIKSSTTTVFTTSIYPNSTTTVQSFCASGCSITKTFSDNTMNANDMLWGRIQLSSTTQATLNIACELQHS